MKIINWPDSLSIRAAVTEAENILVPEFRGRYVANEIMPAKRRQPALATCKDGGFALAFVLKNNISSAITQRKILKVFFKYWDEDFDRTTQRFNLISSFINNHQELNKYFVDFHFLPNALRVEGEILPGISMDLVNGDTLGVFFLKCRERGRLVNGVFATLAQEFLDMCRTFRRLGMAHGDLSNKNIIVTPDHHLKLIDYDSVFVPDMGHNYEQTTTGDKNFQHPKRNESNSPASNIDDNFSQIVIYTILLALSKDSSLLQIANEDEVFTAKDFESERYLLNSPAYKKIVNINDSEVYYMLQILRQAVNCKRYEDIPFLVDVIYSRQEIKASYCGKCGYNYGHNNTTDNYCPRCGTKREMLKM